MQRAQGKRRGKGREEGKERSRQRAQSFYKGISTIHFRLNLMFHLPFHFHLSSSEVFITRTYKHYNHVGIHRTQTNPHRIHGLWRHRRLLRRQLHPPDWARQNPDASLGRVHWRNLLGGHGRWGSVGVLEGVALCLGEGVELYECEAWCLWVYSLFNLQLMKVVLPIAKDTAGFELGRAKKQRWEEVLSTAFSILEHCDWLCFIEQVYNPPYSASLDGDEKTWVDRLCRLPHISPRCRHWIYSALSLRSAEMSTVVVRCQ